MEYHVQSQRLGPQGGRRADPAATDEAQRLAPQPGRSDGRLVVPGSRADRLVASTSRRTKASRNMIAWSATSSVP